MESAEANLDLKDKEILELKDQLEKKLQSSPQADTDSQKKVLELNEELTARKEENDVNMQEVEQLGGQLKETTEELNELRNQLTQAQHERDNLNQEYTNLRNQNEEHVAKLNNLDSQLVLKNTEINTLTENQQNGIDNYKKLDANFKQTQSEQNQKIDWLQQSVHEKSEELETTRAELAKRAGIVTQALNSMENTLDEFSGLMNEADQLKHLIKDADGNQVEEAFHLRVQLQNSHKDSQNIQLPADQPLLIENETPLDEGLRKIQDAQTLEIVIQSSDEFLKHPRVEASQQLNPVIDKLNALDQDLINNPRFTVASMEADSEADWNTIRGFRNEAVEHTIKNEGYLPPALVAAAKNLDLTNGAAPQFKETEEFIGILRENPDIGALQTAAKTIESVTVAADLYGKQGIDPEKYTEFSDSLNGINDRLDKICEGCTLTSKHLLEGLKGDRIIYPEATKPVVKYLETSVERLKSTKKIFNVLEDPSVIPDQLGEHAYNAPKLETIKEITFTDEIKSIAKSLKLIAGDHPDFLLELEEERASRLSEAVHDDDDFQKLTPAEQQELTDFFEGTSHAAKLAQKVPLADIISLDSDDPTENTESAVRMVNTMADSLKNNHDMEQVTEVLATLPNVREELAALMMKKIKDERGLVFEAVPESAAVIVEHIRSAYGTKLSTQEATDMGKGIYEGLTNNDQSLERIIKAMAEMPDVSPEAYEGALSQRAIVNKKLGTAILANNEAFRKLVSNDPKVQGLVSAVHNYQLTVPELDEIRQWTPAKPIPKAAHYVGMNGQQLLHYSDPELFSDDLWKNVVMKWANDPQLFSSSFAFTQTGKNALDVSGRILSEWILDDLTLYGGTGTIAVMLGHADALLENMGYTRENVAKAALDAIHKGLLSTQTQQVASWISPVLGAYQVNRVWKDASTLLTTPDVATAQAAKNASSFLVLSFLNDLAWGGHLTGRMALAFRGFNQLTNVVIHLENRIKVAKARFVAGQLSETDMQRTVRNDMNNISRLANIGDDWKEVGKEVVETLRGFVDASELDGYIAYIDSSYSYQANKISWEQGVANVSGILKYARPATTIASSYPKYLLAKSILSPLVNYGLNNPTAGWLAKLPAKLLGAGALQGTASVYAGLTIYDGMYNNFDTTVNTFLPWIKTWDTYVGGIDFQKAREQGVEEPVSWTRTIKEVAPRLSMSAPNSLWITGTNAVAGSLAQGVDYLRGYAPASAESWTTSADKMAHTLFGHSNSALGYLADTRYIGYAFTPFTVAGNAMTSVYDHFFNHPKSASSFSETDLLKGTGLRPLVTHHHATSTHPSMGSSNPPNVLSTTFKKSEL